MPIDLDSRLLQQTSKEWSDSLGTPAPVVLISVSLPILYRLVEGRPALRRLLGRFWISLPKRPPYLHHAIAYIQTLEAIDASWKLRPDSPLGFMFSDLLSHLGDALVNLLETSTDNKLPPKFTDNIWLLELHAREALKRFKLHQGTKFIPDGSMQSIDLSATSIN